MKKTSYKKGKSLCEGKTKIIWQAKKKDGKNAPGLIIVESKDDITAFDDAKFTKQFSNKAVFATTTTCRVFELLRDAGIPVSYQEQISPTEFLAERCDMIPLEVVARRYAVGSYLKRNPQLTKEKGKQPHRFHNLKVEFFLKTTKGKLVGKKGEVIIKGLDATKGEEDPFIEDPYSADWTLTHSKKPKWDEGSFIKNIKRNKVVSKPALVEEMEDLMRETFLVLEGAWSSIGLRIIDMKIEFGFNSKKELVVSDVIDNDSWRLRDADWQELSKEAFRQGEDLIDVEHKYGLVAEIIQNFRIPKQAIVLWRGSDKDEFPNVDPAKDSGISIVYKTISGHKSPSISIKNLEEILGEYPDGGVILTKVGMSNGLGPTLAARTSWPVISIPASIKSFPEDVWSNLRIPSNVPMSVILSDSNAVAQALKILAQKNPLIYMRIQKKLEELDD